MPKLSIVTPSYNQGQFIKATIDSILSQDFTDFEYIIMDGGSTDETLDILRSYNDPRLTWVSEPDNGQTDAINKGLAKATGDYFAYLNSDDVYKPGAFRQIVEYFETHSDVDMVFGDCEVIDENGDFQSLRKSRPYDIKDFLMLKFQMSQPSTFWRRAVIDSIGMFDPQFHMVMDYDYWIRLGLHEHKSAYIAETFAGFRVHGDNKSMNMLPFMQEVEIVFNKVFQSNVSQTDLSQIQESVFARFYLIKACYLRLNKKTSEARHEARRALQSKLPFPRMLAALLILMESYIRIPYFSKWIYTYLNNLRSPERPS